MNFAIWAGTLFNPNTKFFIVASPGKEKESVIRLARIGYDNIIGFLRGGIEACKASGIPLETLVSIEATEVNPDMKVFDVRNRPELELGRVENAVNIPLSEVNKIAQEGNLD